MKLGIVAQYLNSRNDIRDFILSLNSRIQVSVFLKKSDWTQRELIPDVDVREIKSFIPRSITNTFFKYLFMAFGKIPKSKTNYFFVEYGKLKRSNLKGKAKIERQISLFLSMYLPTFVSYDTYLKNLQFNDASQIDDVDCFVLFSEVYDDLFLAHLIKSGKPIYLYVYSWDHACKMKTFSNNISGYLVWNKGIEEDLIKLHGVDASIIRVFGSTQLSYIEEYQRQKQPNDVAYPFRYIYFGCAFGHVDLAPYEVLYIEEVANVLKKHFPDMKLVVRPYPFLESWQIYSPLKKYDNVVLDDDYRKSERGYSIEKGKIFDKFSKISNADVFMHLGTTLGLEAAYFEIPVLHIDFDLKKDNYLREYMHQYHLDKYLIHNHFPNIIKQSSELPEKIRQAMLKTNAYMEYGEFIRSNNELKSFDELAEKMLLLVK